MPKLLKWLGFVVGGDILAGYLQPLKEALVQQAPFLRPGLKIGPLNVVGHGKSQIEGLEHLVVLDAQAVHALLGCDPFAPDAGLLLSE